MNTRVALAWPTAAVLVAALLALAVIATVNHDFARAFGGAVVAVVLAASPAIIQRIDAPRAGDAPNAAGPYRAPTTGAP